MKMKKEFFFLRKQLQKRFALFLVGLALCLLFGAIYASTTRTYTHISRIPEIHRSDIEFLHSGDRELVSRDANGQTMNTVMYMYKYNSKNGTYKIGFALFLNLSAWFTCIALCFVAVSFCRFMNWHKRFGTFNARTAP